VRDAYSTVAHMKTLYLLMHEDVRIDENVHGSVAIHRGSATMLRTRGTLCSRSFVRRPAKKPFWQ